MTVHIVPVGLSLADHLGSTSAEKLTNEKEVLTAWSNPGLGLVHQNVDTCNLLSRAFGAGSGKVSDNALDGFMDLIDQAGVENWPEAQSMSAEIDAVRAHDVELDDNDLVILLASDTTEGLANAVWNALVLAEGDHKRLWYRDSLKHVSTTSEVRQQIIIMRVPKLGVETHHDFPRALESLTELAELIQGNHVPDDEMLVSKEEELVFHITGGYRATVPYLIAIAEWLRSLRSGEVSARLLPQNADGTVALPLRELDPCDVKGELEYFVNGHCDSLTPDPVMLLGYAYTETEGRFELNEFGRGMRTLFLAGS